MYERFTDRARRVMQLANQEAQRFNNEYIDTEHLLSGLLKEGNGIAVDVLQILGVDIQHARSELECLVQRGPQMVTMGNLPMTPRLKKVIEYSMEEGLDLSHDYIGTEHLLLGLLRAQEGIAATALKTLGVGFDAARKETVQLLSTTLNFRTAKDLGLG